jgi:membrane-bound lytic murein transglycosylase MltF
MNPDNLNATEARRQSLLEQLTAAEAALRANLELNCANVTARVHMQRALAHVQEALVALNGIRRARTVGQLVEDLTRCRRDLAEFQQAPPARPAIRLHH